VRSRFNQGDFDEDQDQDHGRHQHAAPVRLIPGCTHASLGLKHTLPEELTMKITSKVKAGISPVRRGCS